MADQLDAVHLRHVEIGDDDVGLQALLQTVQRIAAVDGFGERADAEIGQYAHQHAALEIVVLDGQHRQLAELHCGSRKKLSERF